VKVITLNWGHWQDRCHLGNIVSLNSYDVLNPVIHSDSYSKYFSRLSMFWKCSLCYSTMVYLYTKVSISLECCLVLWSCSEEIFLGTMAEKVKTNKRSLRVLSGCSNEMSYFIVYARALVLSCVASSSIFVPSKSIRAITAWFSQHQCSLFSNSFGINLKIIYFVIDNSQWRRFFENNHY
jgi:hypothetical protein